MGELKKKMYRMDFFIYIIMYEKSVNFPHFSNF